MMIGLIFIAGVVGFILLMFLSESSRHKFVDKFYEELKELKTKFTIIKLTSKAQMYSTFDRPIGKPKLEWTFYSFEKGIVCCKEKINEPKTIIWLYHFPENRKLIKYCALSGQLLNIDENDKFIIYKIKMDHKIHLFGKTFIRILKE